MAGTHRHLPRPAAVKARATLGGAPGLTRVTPDQEGPQDDLGGHHVAALAPPRTAPGTPREREDHPGCPGTPRNEKTHQSVSTATLGTQDSPRSPRDASDTGGTLEACYGGPDKMSTLLTGGRVA